MRRLLGLLLAGAGLTAALPLLQPADRRFFLDPGTDTLTLSDRAVERGSVTVSRNGLPLVRETDYRVDYPRRRLVLLYDHPAPETLRVRFHEQLLETGRPRSLRRLEQLPGTPDSAAVEAAPPADRDPFLAEPSGLVFTGTKTLGLSAGTGEALSVDQTLDLSIQGELAENVRLRAVLTDQNLPFQPEGNTETLRELDRVFLEIESPRFRAALGDLVLTQPEGRFGRFTRKIKGVETGFQGTNLNLSAAGAVSDALFRSVTFEGQEARQGPWPLTSREGREGITVLSGTERVFVDGRPMKRGQNNDYVIEYGNGQITFTPRCLITAERVITVEFEYLDEAYPRDLLKAGTGIRTADSRFSLNVDVVRESDDPDGPSASPLDSADRLALERAGDNDARGGGSRFLPPDSVNSWRGFYVRVAGTAPSDSYFVYHPPRDTALFRGEPWYRVDFEYAGPGAGDYAADSVDDSTDPGLSGTFSRSRRIYVHRGPALGDYRPGSALASPGSHLLTDARYRGSIGGLFEFAGEAALSERDRNTLSPSDDNDNRGVAAAHTALLRLGKTLDEGGPGRFTLSLSQDYRDARFVPLDAPDDPFVFARRWNLNLSRAPLLGLKTYEGRLAYSPWATTEIAAQAGWLGLSGAKARRAGLEGRHGSWRLGEAQVKTEAAETFSGDTTGRLYRASAIAVAPRRLFTPGLSWNAEFHEDLTGASLLRKSDFHEAGASLLTGSGGAISGESRVTVRADRTGQPGDPGILTDSATGLTLSNRYAWNRGRGFSLDANMVNRRSRRREAGAWKEANSDLAGLVSDIRAFDGGLEQRLRYDLSAERSQTRVDLYEAVPAGTGTHLRDPQTGDYIPRDYGDYRFAGTGVDRNAPDRAVNRCGLGFNLRAEPGRFPRWQADSGALRDLAFDTWLSAEQDKFPGTRGGGMAGALADYLPDLLPSAVNAANSSRYTLAFRQDLLLDAARRMFSLRLRYYPRFRRDYRVIAGGAPERDEWRNLTLSAELRHSWIPRLQSVHEGLREAIERDRRGVGDSYRLVNLLTRNRLTFSAGRNFSFPLGLDGGFSEQRAPTEERVPFFQVRPGVLYTLPDRGRVEADYAYIRVLTDSPTLLYEMADGQPPGLTHRATLSSSVSVNRNIDLSLSYRWERNSRIGRPDQRGNAEFKAFF